MKSQRKYTTMPTQSATKAKRKEGQAKNTVAGWTERKKESLELARMYERIGDQRRADKVRWCADYIRGRKCPNDGHLEVTSVITCDDRFCALCAWRRAGIMTNQLWAEMDELSRRRPGGRLVMLTLTAQDVQPGHLRDEIKRRLAANTKLMRRAKLTRAVLGSVRKLEVTRTEHGTWHPHIHTLLWVRPSYFSSDYVSRKRWAEGWADALGIDYVPVVDVRIAKGDAAPEIGKYVAKPMLKHGRIKPEEFAECASAMRGVRALGWTGEWKKVRAELKHKHPEEMTSEEMTDAPTIESLCPKCKTQMQEIAMKWATSEYAIWQVEAQKDHQT